jgi:Ca-activated chloride channel family protein
MEPRWHQGASILAATLLFSGLFASGVGCNSKPEPSLAAANAEAESPAPQGEGAPAASALAASPAAEPADRAAPPAKMKMSAPRPAKGGAGIHDFDGTGRAGGGPAFSPPGGASPPPPLATVAGKPAGGSGGEPFAAAAAPVPIDPNGRFATTYRPGGGHLAAFESAVARGIIPADEREVVSDVGARYAPAIDAPKGKALSLRTDFERGKLSPSGGPFHVRVTLRSSADKATERPHLSVHLVLDVSGSMAGESITRARDAARVLVDKLAPTDDFSFVTFSNDASVLVPDGPVGPRRDAIKKVISDVREGGGTNISSGLQLGYAQAAAKSIPADAVRVVLLLSDGRANGGITAPDRISKLALDAFQSGIQTSSFGLGADYDGALMSSIAADGAGGYYYLRDAEQIAPALTTEIDKRLDPVATAVEVRVRLKKGVELLRVYGSRRLSEAEAARVRTQEIAADKQAEKRDRIKRDREDDAEGGMRFFIPAFARDDSHALLLQLSVPAGVGNKPLAGVELKYKDRISKKNITDEVPLAVGYGNSDAESAGSADPLVARTIQGFAAGEALAEASARIARGDRAGAASLLSEREGILRKAAETLGEPLFLKDADRLARLRSHAAGADTGVGDPLVLAMLLETAGRAHLH